jgi:CheY-like chemotaxis protein
LFIQNTSIENVSEYLTDAGLRVAQTRDDGDTMATVLRMRPDLIVLDFTVNAETIERLKLDARTKSIPLIGLVEASLARARGRADPPRKFSTPEW